MSGNQVKTPFAQSLVQAADKRIYDAIQLEGKALPASVVSRDFAIVTVQFEVMGKQLPQITCPLAGSEYIRYPIQPGDKGVVYPADVRLGGITGLGGGAANFSLPGNLSALVFFPVGNKNWRKDDINQNEVTIYGPEGVKVRTSNREWTLWLTLEGIGVYRNDVLVMSIGGGVDEINIFNQNLIVHGGDVVADGVSLKHHVHGGVTPGGGNTGQPVGGGS